ncbi:MAG: VacJ family lipoprotein [Syntrophotaleaceae bacterium]
MRSGWSIFFLFLLLTGCGSVTERNIEKQAESALVAPGLSVEEPVGPIRDEPTLEEAAGEEVFEEELTAEAGEEDFTGEDVFDEEVAAIEVYDPIEPFNRGMFWVNDKLYFYLFKPVARGFRVVPEPARQSVSNFFSNLGTPVRFVNSLLQLKMADAGTELGRLAINSTIGIGGLFDPAKKWFDLNRKDEDLGQTLGSYGVGNGVYLVWPIFGPSSARDTVGMVGDFFLDPLYYIQMKPAERIGLNALEQETRLSLDKDTYEAIKRQALDPYIYVRTSYYQLRQGKVQK